MNGTTFFWRIYGGFTGLFLVVVILAVVLADQRTANVAAEHVGAQLLNEAILVRQLLNKELEELPDAAAGRRIQERLDSSPRRDSPRVTIVLLDGTVVADSAERPERMENHANRPELVAARADGSGIDVRRSRTVGLEMLYAAVRVDRDGEAIALVRCAAPLAAVAAVRGAMRWVLALAAVLAAGFALLGGFVFARRVTRPLGALTRSAWSIAGGNFGEPIPIDGTGEIATLAAAFRKMMDRLNRHLLTIETDRAQVETILRSMREGVIAIDLNERILYINHAARRIFHVDPAAASGDFIWEVIRSTDIVEVLLRSLGGGKDELHELRLNRGLHDVVLEVHSSVLLSTSGSAVGALVVVHDASELRRLESIRSDFVSNVSHEMKTPVAAIRGLVESILDDPQMPGETRLDFLQRVQIQGERLTNLVTDLLSLSAAERATVAWEESSDFAAAIRQSVLSLSRAAEDKGIELSTEIPAGVDAQVVGDSESHRHIVDNLLSNAIRYSREGGRVELGVEASHDEVVLRVRDNGPGIEPVHQDRIFERFYRVDKARSRELGGTGLGLAIVKHTVQSLGGTIELDSAPGKGSTFRVALRRSANVGDGEEKSGKSS
jgi:two-component system phosphate regulon sensor histidine kinase PhoR